MELLMQILYIGTAKPYKIEKKNKYNFKNANWHLMEISNMYNYVEMLKMVLCEPQNSFFFP